MMLKRILNRLFHRFHAQNETQKEVNWRMSRLNLDRKLNTLKTEAEECRRAALMLEKQGNHAQAVAKANQYQNKIQAYEKAQANVNTLDTAREMAKNNQTFLDIMREMKEVGEDILVDIDPGTIARVNSGYETTMVQIKDATETMKSGLTNIMGTTDQETFNALGEAALADLMDAEAAAQPVSKTRPAVNVSEELEEKLRWSKERRMQLSQLGNSAIVSEGGVMNE